MAAQGKKKTKDEIAAAELGIPVAQLHALKTQTAAARGRGKRPAGTAGADTKLAAWGTVEGQSELFPVEPDGTGS